MNSLNCYILDRAKSNYQVDDNSWRLSQIVSRIIPVDENNWDPLQLRVVVIDFGSRALL